MAEQSCNVKLPRDLDDAVLEALALLFNSFHSPFCGRGRGWEGRPVLLELQIREIR